MLSNCISGLSKGIGLILALVIGQGSGSASFISLAPVAGQRTVFIENTPGSVMFTITNNNHDPFGLTAASATFKGPLSGESDDQASDAMVDMTQCPSIAGNGGTCNVTVTFATTDTSKAPEDADISSWGLTLVVTAADTKIKNTPQMATAGVVVAVADVNYPEPASVGLAAVGLLGLIATLRKLRRG